MGCPPPPGPPVTRPSVASFGAFGGKGTVCPALWHEICVTVRNLWEDLSHPHHICDRCGDVDPGVTRGDAHVNQKSVCGILCIHVIVVQYEAIVVSCPLSVSLAPTSHLCLIASDRVVSGSHPYPRPIIALPHCPLATRMLPACSVSICSLLVCCLHVRCSLPIFTACSHPYLDDVPNPCFGSYPSSSTAFRCRSPKIFPFCSFRGKARDVWVARQPGICPGLLLLVRVAGPAESMALLSTEPTP